MMVAPYRVNNIQGAIPRLAKWRLEITSIWPLHENSHVTLHTLLPLVRLQWATPIKETLTGELFANWLAYWLGRIVGILVQCLNSEVRCYYHRPQLNCQTVVACQGRGSHFCRLPTLNIIKARPPPAYRGRMIVNLDTVPLLGIISFG